MSDIKTIKLNQTSRNTSEIPDVILISPNNPNTKTRQILRSKIINNTRTPEDTLSVDLIHEKVGDDGTWSTSYQDLRKLKEGESIRIQLDSAQTRELFNNISEHYEISKLGVRGGTRYVISTEKDIENIIFAESSDKKALARKVMSEISDTEARDIVSSDSKLIKGFFNSLPKIRVDILESLKTQLEGNLTQNEKNLQKWIDENRKVRCMIFGLEFIDYKREVSFGNSRFDILTEQSGLDHVIIEMKSPNVKLFDVVTKTTANGTKDEYIISKDLGEAIPQVIKYFDEYDRENDETFKKNGVSKKKISKAIILIGRNEKDNPVWQEHFNRLRHRLSGIEMLTYDHLVEKIGNQIENLKMLSNEENI
jgi:Domain of unknown function (DUF4263)